MMIRDLIKKFDYCWIFFFITVILCYGSFLTNSSMGIDDEMLSWYGSAYSSVAIGRLGRITQWVIGYEYLPFFYDFIAIALFSIGICIFGGCFMQNIKDFSNTKAVLFSSVAVSFPFYAFAYVFMIMTVHFGASILCSGLSTLLFCKYTFGEKKKSDLLYSLLLLIYSVSLYETGIIYFLISIFFILFFKLKNKEDYLKTKKVFFTTFVFALLSLFIYYSLLKICKLLMSIGYNRSREFIKYNFVSVSGFFKSLFNAFNELYTNFIQTIPYNFGSFVAALSILLFGLIVIYLLIKNRNILTFFIGCAILILPLGTFLITGNANLYYRIYTPISFLAGITFVCLFDLVENKKVISTICLILVSLIILNQARECNRIFYFDNLKFNDDLAFARFIVHDLGRLNLDKKKIVLAGKKDNITLTYDYSIEAPELLTSIFNWDKPEGLRELYIDRGIRFMHHHGLNIIKFDEVSAQSAEKMSKDIPLMPEYPREGYIKDEGDFVIVKIGKSYFDKTN